NTGSSEAELLDQLAAADKDALSSLGEAVNLAPNDARCLASVGGYWAFKPSMQTDEAQRKADTDNYQTEARKAYEKAIHAAPDEFEAYLHLANLYRRAGRYDEAGQVLEQRLARGI